jgi:hypothetical protein
MLKLKIQPNKSLSRVSIRQYDPCAAPQWAAGFDSLFQSAAINRYTSAVFNFR